MPRMPIESKSLIHSTEAGERLWERLSVIDDLKAVNGL